MFTKFANGFAPHLESCKDERIVEEVTDMIEEAEDLAKDEFAKKVMDRVESKLAKQIKSSFKVWLSIEKLPELIMHELQRALGDIKTDLKEKVAPVLSFRTRLNDMEVPK